MEIISSLDESIGTSYTDGKNIYLYLFSCDIEEGDIELEINLRFVHELIHTIDMSLHEVYVSRMVYSILG